MRKLLYIFVLVLLTSCTSKDYTQVLALANKIQDQTITLEEVATYQELTKEYTASDWAYINEHEVKPVEPTEEQLFNNLMDTEETVHEMEVSYIYTQIRETFGSLDSFYSVLTENVFDPGDGLTITIDGSEYYFSMSDSDEEGCYNGYQIYDVYDARGGQVTLSEVFAYGE